MFDEHHINALYRRLVAAAADQHSHDATGNWLFAKWWPTPRADDAALAAALAELRQARAALVARAADKRRRLADTDREMVTLGLRMRNAANRLSEVDAAEFKRHYRHRRLLVTSHGQFQALLSNVESQLLSLEDTPALTHAVGSLASSTSARTAAMRDMESSLAATRAKLAALTDTGAIRAMHAAIDVSLEGLDSAHELDALMHNTEFMGQFDLDELERVRIALLRAPAPPSTVPVASSGGLGAAAPGAACPQRDAEAAFGL